MPSSSSVARIPIPTDNYDAPHSTIASLTSLRAMVESFDAVMDSLSKSVEIQSARVDRLGGRVERCREKLAAVRSDSGSSSGKSPEDGDGEEENAAVRLVLPANYAKATAGTDRPTDDGDAKQDEESPTSALDSARTAAHRAITSVLRTDRSLDDGRAVPSDSWLDVPTAFDTRAECRLAVRSHEVPSLHHQMLTVEDEVDYYEDFLAGGGSGGGGGTASSAVGDGGSSGLGGRSSSGRSGGGGASSSDDDGAGTVQTGMTGLSLSSRLTEGGMASASERRRQRQQAQRERQRRQKRRQAAAAASAGGGGGAGGSASASAAVAAAAVEDLLDQASASRQQALSGSRPYLCEVLHDAYGSSGGGAGGTVFPPPKSADELLVFNSRTPVRGGSGALPSTEQK